MRREINWSENCGRCAKKSNIHTMSVFNTDLICMECDAKERKHPKYGEACLAESDAVRRGEYDFPGIGKPSDL